MTHFLFSSTVKHKPAVRCRVNTFIALFHYNIFCQTGCVKVVFGVAQFISLSWGVSSSTVKRKVNNQLPLNGIIRCCKSPLFFSPLPVLFSLPFHSGTMSICFHFFLSVSCLYADEGGLAAQQESSNTLHWNYPVR